MGTVEMYADVMEEATNRVLTPLLVQEQELQIVRCHKTSHVEVVELIEHTKEVLGRLQHLLLHRIHGSVDDKLRQMRT